MKRQPDLNEERLKLIEKEFIRRISRDEAVFLQTCARCGLCADSCHYYIAEAHPHNTPAYKLNLLVRAFNKLQKKAGKSYLDETIVNEWIDTLFGRCTLCGRCVINCTMGINIPHLIRSARGSLDAAGLVPVGLQSTVTTALDKGNNMGISKEDWLETVEWLEEELQDDMDDSGASIPVDVKNSRFLYTINPREAMFFPLSISAAAKVFYSAGESWTFSSENFDVTNYGLYSGSDRDAGKMSKRLSDSLQKLNCRELILAECGHGFNSNRWEAPEWLQKHYSFPVRSIIEVMADYIRQGRLRLDPEKNSKTVTLHDPCNLVRLGGIIEEQRFVLSHSVKTFVEMYPNREKNFCCGGGGGQLAMTRFAERRMQAGRIKADQIRETGAEIVVTPCHNCIDQLMELNKHYKLNIEIKTLTEMVAEAIA